jgi:release factor glutamine methyltransferase
MPNPATELDWTDQSADAPTLGAAVAAMTRAFTDAGLDTPALDARRLATFALGLGPVSLLREPERPLSGDDRTRLAEAVTRRLAREPVSRILGRRAFHGLDLEIGPSTLDPRPETETLVDSILGLAAEGLVAGGRATPRILDLGTGSGAILLALLHGLPDATGLGTDISADALAIAGRNAARHGLAGRAELRQSSWLDNVDGRFDIIVSNPPYSPGVEIATLDPEVTRFDPIAALDGGVDGLAAYRAIAANVSKVLARGAWIAVEVGAGQCEDATRILRNAFPAGTSLDRRVWPDLSGIDRCVAVKART